MPKTNRIGHMWIAAGASVIVVIVAVGVGVACGLNKSDWAAWVQAIGSIAAIAGAFLIGERQAKHAREQALELEQHRRKERLSAYMAIVSLGDSVVEPIRRIFQGFTPNELDLLFFEDQRDRALESVINALGAVPLHELGSPALIASFGGLKNSLVDLQIQVKRCADIVATNLGNVFASDVDREQARTGLPPVRRTFLAYDLSIGGSA